MNGVKRVRALYGAIAPMAVLLIAAGVSANPEHAWADARTETGKQSEATKSADYLFVQTAHSMTFDEQTKTLTLHGISPVTLFFSDRPGVWFPS